MTCGDSDRMYTPGNPDVPDDVFADVLKQITDFVRTRVMPRELEIMTTDAIPADLRAQAAEMGLFGYAIPQEWGGLGLDLVQDVEVAMELGYTSLALRSMFGTNNGIAGQVLVGFGTDEQKARWLPGIASGEVVASFALTEPGAGSNPAGLRTTRHAPTVTAGSSTAASGSSPTPPTRTCSWCSPVPSPRDDDRHRHRGVPRPRRRARRHGGRQGREDGPGGLTHRRRHVRRRAASGPRPSSAVTATSATGPR